MLHEPDRAQIQKNPLSNSIIEELSPIKCKHQISLKISREQ